MAANRWSWVALGVGAYLAFTIASFPAATAYRWFASDNVQLAGIRGTLWIGSAAAGTVSGIALQNVRWRVHPLPLLMLRVSADLEARLPDGFVNARVSASSARVRFRDVRVSTSVAALRNVLPVSGMRGLANVNLTELELTDGSPTAAVGELRLADLEVAPLIPNGRQELIPIGDYVVQFQPAAPGGIAASFNDTSGPLEVSGTLTLDASGKYLIDALIKPRAGAHEDLVQGLAIMTEEPDNAGRRRLVLPGSL